ncbi:MAG: DUF2628 domain-containing protein [Alphaproteobacteria bacterium]|nr:DUF2628 domain-containing protein [Alphaproteobacteria bacterium]
MASFVVLAPPDGDETNERAVFIRDGFAVWALCFHLFWLLWHRLWFAAALLFLVFIGLGAAVDAFPQWALFSAVAWLFLVWFLALEGNGLRIARKERQNWQIQAVIEAQNMATAEEIYYAGITQAQPAAVRRDGDGDGEKKTTLKPLPGRTEEMGSSLGLLGFQERH